MLKDPLGLAIVQQLLWIADMLKMFGCKARVISVDTDLSLLDPEAKKSTDVKFIEGDIMQVEKLFPENVFKVDKKTE